MKNNHSPRVVALVAFAILSNHAMANDPVSDSGDGPVGTNPNQQDVKEVAASTPNTWQGLRDWFSSGKAYLKLRYRLETVDQDGFNKDATASTLRTLFGYELGTYGKFGGLLEFEDVQVIGEDSYNSTLNGNGNRPVVADPEGGEVNQAYFTYAFNEQTNAKVGRQRIILDNARFVGNVGWRQNEQTYDAVMVGSDALDGVHLTYAYLQNANRIFSEGSTAGDVGSNSHVLHGSHEFDGIGQLSVYGYLLDLDIDALSTTTLGARFSGKHNIGEKKDLLYTLEFAQQDDSGDNPNTVDAGYMLGELGMGISGVTFKVGVEILEGSAGNGSFSTPLATLHAFNGWADKFLSTPGDGLEDTYLMVKGKVNQVALTGVYHDFSSETGSTDYGSELDLSAGYKVAEGLDVGLKYADFSSDDAAFSDTTKMWLWMGMSF